MRAPRRILAVKPSSLGDIVHTFPALEMLRRAFPEAELDYLVHPAFSGALDYSPWRVSHRIFFERGQLGRMASFAPEFAKLARELRARRYDLVIDFQGLFRSAFFSRLAAGTGKVAGFAAPRERSAAWFYSVKVDACREHAVERKAELAVVFCGTEEVPELPVPPVPPGSAPPKGLPERYLLLLPGARWKSKRFPTGLFAETAKLVTARFPDLRTVVAGAGDEFETAEELCAKLPFGAINICGHTTLNGLFETVRGAAGVVCNDSGPMHIAALMRRPVCAFFGPTRPGATGPWGNAERCRVLRRKDLDCLECMRRECPVGKFRCFEIAAAEAAEEMCVMLSNKEQEA